MILLLKMFLLAWFHLTAFHVAPKFTLITGQGSVISSNDLCANRTPWGVCYRSWIKWNIATCKETSLVESTARVSIVVNPGSVIFPSTWSRSKMADLPRYLLKLIYRRNVFPDEVRGSITT